MIDFTNKQVGDFGENFCEKYLKKTKKYKILARNKTISHLEADIIAYNKDYLIFVEVKTRRSDKKAYYGWKFSIC